MNTDAPKGEPNITPTIGIFVGVYGGYQDAIWNGIVQVAKETYFNALCFAGASLEDKLGFRKYWNAIYALASPANIDGLIVCSNALREYVTLDEMAHFCASYAPLPVVSIGAELDGIPSVSVDDSSAGLYTLMKHLLEQHQYRRIAFIQGPVNNQEAKCRYRDYLRALEEYDISFDARLVAPGNYLLDSGVEAIRLLLDQRRVSFDAVVASNDAMAFGAWKELERRGFDIPGDVAITGFDDAPEAFSTPLTTVRQSLSEQGRLAAQMLVEYFQYGTPLKNIKLGTEPVIRESCGCLPWVTNILNSSLPVAHTDFSRSTLIKDLQDVVCPHFPSVTHQLVEQLVDAFYDVLKGESSSQFFLLFNRLLQIGVRHLSNSKLEKESMLPWQHMLSILRMKLLSSGCSDATGNVVDELLHRGRILVAKAAERVHLDSRRRAGVGMLIQAEIVRDINTASDVAQIADILADRLPGLGIHTFALALYQGKPVPPKFSKLILACKNGKRVDLEPGGRLFPSDELLPQDILPHDQWPFLTLHPLVARDIDFGYILMELVVGHWSLHNTYIALSEQIGAALYRGLLQQQIKQANEDLQRQAVELDAYAHTVAHGLKNPLAVVLGYTEWLVNDFESSSPEEIVESLRALMYSSRKMKSIIDELLLLASVRKLDDVETKPLDMALIVKESLGHLSAMLDKCQAQIILPPEDSWPVALGYASWVEEVWVNYISNALKYGGSPPRVELGAERELNGMVRFWVRDNGEGLDAKEQELLFLPFTRLSQASISGHGLGLSIVQRIIEKLGGRVGVESGQGKGSTFYFILPAEVH